MLVCLGVVRAPAGCPLGGVETLSPGGTGTVEFSIDEEGTARLNPTTALLVTATSATTTHFAFSLQRPTVAPDGFVDIDVELRDVVGNTASTSLDWRIELDQTPPVAPDVNSPTDIVYSRAPWGGRGTGPAYSVSGVVRTRDAKFVEVTYEGVALRLSPVVDGGFHAALYPPDRPIVSVRALDDGCNASPVVNVRNVEWLASLNGKVAGSSTPNPHQLELRDAFNYSTTESLGVSEAAVFPQSLTGRRQWRSQSLIPHPFYPDPHVMYDKQRQRVIVLASAFSGSGVAVWEWSPSQRLWFDRTVRQTNHAPQTTDFGATFDPVRKKVILFGGPSSAGHGALWEFDVVAGSWANRTPSILPSAWPTHRGENDIALMYHPKRKTILALTGVNSPQLWELDSKSATWVERTPGGSLVYWPSHRSVAKWLYDEQREKVMLFSSMQYLRELNESTWLFQRAQNESNPSEMSVSSSATETAEYDVIGRRVLAFSATENASNTLWSWAPTALWQKLQPASTLPTRPSPAAYPGMTYDTSRNRMVLVNNSIDAFMSYMPEVWSLNGQTLAWENETAKTDAGGPADNIYPLMTTDSAGVVVYGDRYLNGNVYAIHSRLWRTLPDGGWSVQTPAVDAGWPAPNSPGTHSLFFDAARQMLVLVNHALTNDGKIRLWEMPRNGTLWTNRTDVDAGTWPAVSGNALAFDEARGRLVLFGADRSDQLTEWNGRTGEWESRTVTPRPSSWPSARTNASATYDANRRRIVFYGGNSVADGSPLDELWEWDGQGWHNRTNTKLTGPWPPPTQQCRLCL